jgi:pyridoxamine 5'-phosphate oxidase
MTPQNNFLTEDNTDKNPFKQFSGWYNSALESDFPHPDAMTLATAGKNGKPSARIVLLKGFDENGFVFFTNYESRKGNELIQNPYASLVFYWDKLDRQVRIEGVTEKISLKESGDYFHSRPRGSQLGALVSPQSKIIESCYELEKKYEELEKKYEGQEIPLSKNWGGLRLKPVYFEFWQNRDNRLHDRIVYTIENNSWKINRLAP